MKLGMNIRAVRKRCGLTLAELSSLCGIGRDELGAYELGKATPRAETVKRIAEALQVPITTIQNGMGWSEPQEEGWERSKDDSLLYDGILENLRESFGQVDSAEDGSEESKILVGTAQDSFFLDEADIRALINSVKASIPVLIEYMKDTRPEQEINNEILEELNLVRDSEEDAVRRYALTDAQWEQLRDLLPPERTGKGRPFKSNRLMMDGILFWMKSGTAWKNLPKHFGRYQCVIERLQLWCKTGVLQPVMKEMFRMGIITENSIAISPEQLESLARYPFNPPQ